MPKRKGAKLSATPPHSWDLTLREAIELQKQLKDRIRTDLELGQVRQVAGVDVAYLPATRESVASVVMLSYPHLHIVESALARMETPFPYVPGLLSFRELPIVLKALEKLSRLPDLTFVDGHGRAHPRRFGIASHLGFWLKKPAIGVGKSCLCGRYREPGKNRGSRTNLIKDEEVIGQVVRTRTGVKPVFVSVGYGLPLEDCVKWTLRVTRRFRIPEPIRLADQLCRQAKGRAGGNHKGTEE